MKTVIKLLSALAAVDASIAGEFGRIMAWADKYRRLKVRTNADTPHDAAKARELGAQGIGLCRTEHMFFEGDRIAAIREMICSDTVEQREKALAKLLPMQQGDFEGIYEAMEGNPVTIRFLKKKIYHVHLDKNVTAHDLQQIAEGIELEDGPIHADAIEYASPTDKKQVGIEIHSGKNRIVRRIFEHLGYKVTKLDRVLFAGLTKKNVRRGDWRFLTEKEVDMLRMGAFE